VVVKIGCVLVPLGLIFAFLAFVGFEYYENENENAAARKLWLSLCDSSKLYESGTFENWDQVYLSIETGRFPDSVHLVQVEKNGWEEKLWKVDGSDRVFLKKYDVSFMETDNKMRIRDPQFREWYLGIHLFSMPHRDHSCIDENHKKLDELLWTYR
jgi:hypothetical protein